MTELVISYQKGNVSYEAISGHISLYAYDFPRRVKHWDQDRCSDFFVFIHPRLKKIADTFVFSDLPFESYLNASLKHQLNSFIKKQQEKRIKEELFCNICASGSLADEGALYRIYDTFNYEVTEPEISYRHKVDKVRNKKRILFLALSHPDQLDDKAIEHLSALTGYNADCLSMCCIAVKEKVQKKRESLRLLRERKNGWYFQILVIQRRIMDEPDPEKRIWLEEQIQRLRFKIERANRMIKAKVSCLVSHQDLADVLGIPKGTVDSSLYYLMRKSGHRKIKSSSADRLSLRSLLQLHPACQ